LSVVPFGCMVEKDRSETEDCSGASVELVDGECQPISESGTDTGIDTDTDTGGYSGDGYGDVDEGGYPSWSERESHLWTNAVRVAPEAFEYSYNLGGCSFDDFEASEKTPKAPLYYDRNLNLAARAHCDDMYSNSWFDYDSSDGTAWDVRIAQYYSESSYTGENIAYGYDGGYNTIMLGWMCSSGHRSNIMLADYNELGTGEVNDYHTQDFARGTVDTDGPVAWVCTTRSLLPGT
ncbi:MAG: CAP domain-containing protein, partial [Myxococcota bacterium]|nr:CAP domain-containing protein [Myxococcota bacterium]